MSATDNSSQSSLATWEALCKDCRNKAIRAQRGGKATKKRKDDLRQPEYEYSDVHATRQFERGQSRSDRCPECRKRHKKEIAAFPVAYIDVTAIGEASKYVTDEQVGPTGPLGGLGPLPATHTRRVEHVDLDEFELGLKSKDIVTLLEKMQESQVVILEAGTGTGKSTLAPFRLMNPPDGAPYRPTDVGPIIVTEPRVPATTEVAQFVGEAMCFGHDPETCFSHVGPGYPVGYQCEGQKNWDEACSLVYVTDGTMVNWITNGDLARIGTVIVDEAHERSDNIDTILTLLAAKLPRYPHLRVIIASATIDKNYFMSFFRQTPSIRVDHQYAEAKKAIGYGVPLFADIEFTEELLEHGFIARDPTDPDGEPRFVLPGWPNVPNPEEEGRTLRDVTRDTLLGIRSPASDWPKTKNVVEAAVTQTIKILQTTTSGDILVFLPTEGTVTEARDKIAACVQDTIGVDDVTIHWLMRKTPQQEKKQALAACPPGQRKVVVASNLAETSLTIAGIKYVVDSGLVSQTVWDPDLAVPAHPLMAHSQSGIRQRWGRVGRKTHGWVFPLYSLADYLKMPRDTPAGSTQTNLESTMLKIIAAGEDPSAVVYPADFEADGVVRDRFAQDSADNFRRERQRALAAAKTNGAVGPDGKTLTRLGAELTRSRVSSEKAIALMFADRLACVPEVATVLVALAGREDNERDKGRLAGPDRLLASHPDWPLEWNVHARRCHEALAIGCTDDLDLVIRVFSDWKAAPNPTQWCAQWWVNEDVLESVETAAAKLMDGLAPGMSKEATRPLDPRLAVRARAVLSRALGSLRYHRSSDGLWRSANPAQPDPVGASPSRLTAPPDQVVALVRELPNNRRAGPLAEHGEMLGLVKSLPWATDDDPTDFELLRRVSLRREESLKVDDPTRDTRTRFPIGALIEIAGDGSSAPTIHKLTDGLAKPDIRPRDVVSGPGDPATARQVVYTSETGASSDELNLKPRAGAETPEEEARLTPIAIAELENPELEDFAGLAPYTSAEPAPPRAQAAITVARYRSADVTRGIVVGYRVSAGSIELALEPPPPARTEPRQIGDDVRVRNNGPVATNLGPVNELQAVNDDGHPIPGDLLYTRGVSLDQLVTNDAAAVSIGSTWSARVVPGVMPGHTLVSLADSVLERVRTDPAAKSAAKPPTIAAVVATLTSERYVDWQQNQCIVAATDAFAPDLTARFAVRLSDLERAGVAARPGARVKLELWMLDRARKSGEWRPEDVEMLVSEPATVFKAGTKPKFLGLAKSDPLDDAGVARLLAVDPSDRQYERNAWLLWQTSRHFGVRRVSALGEVDVAPDAAQAIQRAVNQSGVRKQFSVGITISDTGKVSVSGNHDDVTAAVDYLRGAALHPRYRVNLPARPDGKKPLYPRRQDVVDALAGIDVLDTQLDTAYDEKNGWLDLNSPNAVAAASNIAAALTGVASYEHARLTFQQARGFLEFQKKVRWDAISARVDGLMRWPIVGGISWGLFASRAGVVATGIAETRAELGSVPFAASPIESTRPLVIEIPAITDQFDLSYQSPASNEDRGPVPPPAEPAHPDDGPASGVSLSGLRLAKIADHTAVLLRLDDAGLGFTEFRPYAPNDVWRGALEPLGDQGLRVVVGEYVLGAVRGGTWRLWGGESGPYGEHDFDVCLLAESRGAFEHPYAQPWLAIYPGGGGAFVSWHCGALDGDVVVAEARGTRGGKGWVARVDYWPSAGDTTLGLTFDDGSRIDKWLFWHPETLEWDPDLGGFRSHRMMLFPLSSNLDALLTSIACEAAKHEAMATPGASPSAGSTQPQPHTSGRRLPWRTDVVESGSAHQAEVSEGSTTNAPRRRPLPWRKRSDT